MKTTFAIVGALLVSIYSFAGPAVTTDFIHIDQFGYRTGDTKVAVISDPQTGYNSGDAFTPGTTYEVRRSSDDATVYSGSITQWNGGSTHGNSGDRGWWFDFSSVTTEGTYYIYDVSNAVGSYEFDIRDDIYNEILKASVRMFYHNRCGIEHNATHAGANWSDAISFQQEEFTMEFGNSSNTKDLRGGWFDAGDYNKYVTFLQNTINDLLDAYERNPLVFGDDYNIPESGNGIPDIIDEIKYELDWVKKMQDVDGGVIIKMGNIDYTNTSPPSSDNSDRYFGPKCSSSTITTASIFAHAALVFSQFPSLSSYASDLEQRAIDAWDWYHANPKSDACDLGDIKSGDADRSIGDQNEIAVVAAVYLWELTGNSTYDDFVKNNYSSVEQMNIGYWGPYKTDREDALLRYTTLPGADGTVTNAIINEFEGELSSRAYLGYRDNDDLYRAHMEASMYHWGSNSVASKVGNLNMNAAVYGVDALNQSNYEQKALEMVHYIHGVNPQNMVYLSNMYSYGAENSANEMYHTWFGDGTVYDNALTSSNGPAPGFLTGGPNSSYGGNQANIAGQPGMKAYRDWNSGWPENSWEVTEPAIYYQAAFVKMLAPFAGQAGPSCESPDLGADQSICGQSSISLNTGLGTTGRTFTWTKDGSSIGGNTTSLTITEGGTYVVSVDSSGCVRTDEVVISDQLLPDLGPDVDLCSPSEVTLDAVDNGAGYSYSWEKDGVTIAGETSQTLLVGEAGTYTVTISASGCSDTSDEIVVTSSLLDVTGDTICSSGTANLSVAGGGSYEWYNVATNGSSLASGSSYSPSIASSTTFYVEDAGGVSETFGESTQSGTVWGLSGTDFDASDKKIKITVSQSVTLDAVSVYVNSATEVTINLTNEAGTVVEQTATVTGLTAGKQRIALNFSIDPGVYLLDASGTNGYLDYQADNASFPYSDASGTIIQFENNEGWASGWYGLFYDWEISVGNSCDRTPVYAVIDAGHPSCTCPDSDSDGVDDCSDGCPSDPNKIAVGTCGCGVADTDSDSDGTPDCSDGCPSDPNKIAVGTCGCGVADTDSDSDGTPDCNDACPSDPNKIAAGTCGCGVADTDSDSDGTPDCNDACPSDPNKIAAGTCGCGVADTDSDSDGTPDCNDACPSDPNKIAAGTCGCGVADTDSDSDGTPDCNDACPSDPNKIAAGTCGCGVADTDSDSDGTPDCNDACPSDPNKIVAGACGCGVAEGTCTDCNGVVGGTAYMDNCSNCVGGNTGEVECTQDCNGDWGGTAYTDNCSDCVGGNTGEVECTQDCNGDWGGTAYTDNCNDCVGGNTGEVECTQDCNGDWGGSASVDNCSVCSGGNTGVAVDECLTSLDTDMVNGITVYPNPTTGIVHIQNAPDQLDWRLLDVFGRELLSGSGLTIDLNNLPAGLYSLRINSKVIRLEKQ